MDIGSKRQLNKFYQGLVQLLIAYTLSFAATAFAKDKETSVAVIYPDIREPYLSVFKEIKTGIDQSLEMPAKTILINKKTTASSLAKRLDEALIDSVITLGSGAYQFADEISDNRHVISGAVFTRPGNAEESISSISMIVSPSAQFAKLKSIAPNVSTIHVIYNPVQDNWLIQRARSALKNSDINLNAIAREGLKETAHAYQELLDDAKLSSKDALWLLQSDRVISESTVLSQVLQHAWDQRFIVFSANPSHVKRGALFATYPNNTQLGERLGNTLIADNENTLPHVDPLEDLRIAFNTRTAEHLKLNISRSKQKSFDLVFPNR